MFHEFIHEFGCTKVPDDRLRGCPGPRDASRPPISRATSAAMRTLRSRRRLAATVGRGGGRNPSALPRRPSAAQRRRCRRRPRRRGSHHRRTLSGTFFLVGGTGEITPAAAAPCRCEMSGAQRQRTRLRGMDWESELPPSFQLQVGSLRWMASSRTEDSDGPAAAAPSLWSAPATGRCRRSGPYR